MFVCVCRFATEVYFDCTLPAEEVSEYNHMYRAYWGRDLVRSAICLFVIVVCCVLVVVRVFLSVHLCVLVCCEYLVLVSLLHSHQNKQNKTLDEIMTIESRRVLRLLLTHRHDPHMMHQANLRTFSAYDPKLKRSAVHSLVSLWTRYVLLQLRQVSHCPCLVFRSRSWRGRCWSERV